MGEGEREESGGGGGRERVYLVQELMSVPSAFSGQTPMVVKVMGQWVVAHVTSRMVVGLVTCRQVLAFPAPCTTIIITFLNNLTI